MNTILATVSRREVIEAYAAYEAYEAYVAKIIDAMDSEWIPLLTRANLLHSNQTVPNPGSNCFVFRITVQSRLQRE